MDAKATAWRYLRAQREAVLWKVEGLRERDQRMPMTGTGTNLLGRRQAPRRGRGGVLRGVPGRPWPEPMAFWADDAEPNDDMWATEDESPAEILDLYRRVTAFADETIEPLPLDAPATVPWWRTPETDLHTLLVHMAVETARHAGTSTSCASSSTAPGAAAAADQPPRRRRGWWEAYVARLRGIAERPSGPTGRGRGFKAPPGGERGGTPG